MTKTLAKTKRVRGNRPGVGAGERVKERKHMSSGGVGVGGQTEQDKPAQSLLILNYYSSHCARFKIMFIIVKSQISKIGTYK